MNIKTTLSALTLGLALLPLSASATLLVGFHDFDGTTATQTVTAASTDNYALTGFSGTVNKDGQTSIDTGGSLDNLYGNSAIPVTGANPGDDGLLRVYQTSKLIVSMTNVSGPITALESFLFDATSTNGASGSGFTFDYKKASDAVWSTAVVLKGIASGSGSAIQDYADFSVNLTGLYLAAGETIQFRFASSAGARLDNLALTGLSAIPETASAMVLALLIGGGLMTRNRRSAAAPTLA